MYNILFYGRKTHAKIVQTANDVVKTFTLHNINGRTERRLDVRCGERASAAGSSFSIMYNII